MAKHPTSRNPTYYFQVSTQWKSGKARLEIEAFPGGVQDYIYLVRKKDRCDFEFRLFIYGQWMKASFLKEKYA